MDKIKKFQELLREIFEFEASDLDSDFGEAEIKYIEPEFKRLVEE